MRQVLMSDIYVEVGCIHDLQGEDCAGCGHLPDYSQVREAIDQAILQIPGVVEVKQHG